MPPISSSLLVEFPNSRLDQFGRTTNRVGGVLLINLKFYLIGPRSWKKYVIELLCLLCACSHLTEIIFKRPTNVEAIQLSHSFECVLLVLFETLCFETQITHYF